MRYYAIRHKPTGRFMPETCKGYSYWDPLHLNGAYPPRLFVKRRSAANALTCWLSGNWSRITGTESEGWEYPSYTVVLGTQPEPVLGRNRDDMEVVEMSLGQP